MVEREQRSGLKLFSAIIFMHVWQLLLQEEDLLHLGMQSLANIMPEKCSIQNTAQLRGAWPCFLESWQDTFSSQVQKSQCGEEGVLSARAVVLGTSHRGELDENQPLSLQP